MSSAFLYVGIVVIWLFVLVPRWLRRHHAAAQLDLEQATGPPGDLIDDEYEVPDSESDLTDEADDRQPLGSETAREYEVRRPAPAPRLTRSRVLAARRRLLFLLVLLTSAVGACAYLKITTWWTFIPPAGMLGMYLLLLREAAVADAEQARLREAAEWRAEVARERAWRAQEAAEAEEAAATEYVQYEQRSAQVIDISRRVGGDQLFDQYADPSRDAAGDQLYDQYADAAVRAVGD
jgi:uncharacterized membrane protein